MKNTGELDGSETVLLYVAPPENSGYRPLRELKGVRKLRLAAGESGTAEFQLDDRCFAVWQDGWVVPAGSYTVQAGTLSGELELEGEECCLRRDDWYGVPSGKPSREAWESLPGIKYTEDKPVRGQFTMENSVMEMKKQSLVMKIMFLSVKTVIGRGFPKERRNMDCPEYKLMLLTGVGIPLRSMQISAGTKDGLFQGLLEMANGHFLRGLWKMLKKD